MTHSPSSPSDRIEITEVGLRDGLQMEKIFLPTADKIAIGEALIAAGVRRIEATAFVSPNAVPQMRDAAEVVGALHGRGAMISALAPNPRGADAAVTAGCDEVMMFISASESHNGKNVNRSVAQSLETVPEMAAICAGRSELTGAVATAFGCPFQGDITPDQVARVVEGYAASGIRRVTLGDTTGMATPPVVVALCDSLTRRFPEIALSLHFHNTRGLGLINVAAALSIGQRRFESSLGGLGGCPFAPGATGNVCTEDLIHYLDETAQPTGIDLAALIPLAQRLEEALGRPLPGQVMRAGPRLALSNLDVVRTARA